VEKPPTWWNSSTRGESIPEEVSLPTLFAGQTVDLAFDLGRGARWFTSRLLHEGETTDGSLRLSWPLDTERFLPTPIIAEPGQALVLAVRGPDGRLWAADMVLIDEAAGEGGPEMVVRQTAHWRPLERRGHARRTVELASQRAERLLASGDRQVLRATLRDLSAGGLLLRADQCIAQGDRIALAFTLGGDPQPVEAIVQVRRVAHLQEGSLHRWEAGCRFLELRAADRERIEQFTLRRIEVDHTPDSSRGAWWRDHGRRVVMQAVLAAGLLGVSIGVIGVAKLDPAGGVPSALASTGVLAGAAARQARPGWSAYGYTIPAPKSLWPALEVLRARGYDWALDALNARPLRLTFTPLAPHISGVYGQSDDSIRLAAPLELARPETQAAVLVHEATHLSDVLHGRWEGSRDGCLQFEERALANEASFWRELWGPSGKPVPTDEWEAALNDLVWSFTYERAWGHEAVSALYSGECAS
jgi:PilZ domain-containing protein